VSEELQARNEALSALLLVVTLLLWPSTLSYPLQNSINAGLRCW
jgi:hypothetical protein